MKCPKWIHCFVYPEYADEIRDEELDDLKLDLLCGAFDGETVVGVGGIHVQDGIAEVVKVYVDQDHQRKGISSKIMNFLEEWTKNQGICVLKLYTGIRQTAAIALYRKLGYEEISCYNEWRWPPEFLQFVKFFQKTL